MRMSTLISSLRLWPSRFWNNLSARVGARLAGFDAQAWLIVYLRLLAIVFLAGGAAHWVAILYLPTDPAHPLGALPPSARVTTIVFSVLDPIAAVGLWLAAAWGTVVWLLAAVARIVLNTGYIDDAPPDPLLFGFHAMTLVVYLVLSSLAQRAAERRRGR